MALARGGVAGAVENRILTGTALFLLRCHALDGRRNRSVRRAASHQLWARFQAPDWRENGGASHAISRGHGPRGLLGRADPGHAHPVRAVRGGGVVVSVGSGGSREGRVVARHGGGSSPMSGLRAGSLALE